MIVKNINKKHCDLVNRLHFNFNYQYKLKSNAE